MSEEPKDCLQCRLTSGGGLLVAGVYVLHQAKKLKSYSYQAVTAIGFGLSVLGVFRIFGLPPFRSHTKTMNKQNVDSHDENEYIIGEFSSKFKQ